MGNIEFTDWLDRQLKESGWTGREFARRAGVSSGTMSKVMTRQILPSWDFCLGVGRALQMEPERVFRVAGLLPPLLPAVEEEKEALRLLRGLPALVRDTVMTMLRALGRREGLPTAGVPERPEGLFSFENEPLVPELLEEFRRVPDEWKDMVIAQARMYQRMDAMRGKVRMIGEEEDETERETETQGA